MSLLSLILILGRGDSKAQRLAFQPKMPHIHHFATWFLHFFWYLPPKSNTFPISFVWMFWRYYCIHGILENQTLHITSHHFTSLHITSPHSSQRRSLRRPHAWRCTNNSAAVVTRHPGVTVMWRMGIFDGNITSKMDISWRCWRIYWEHNRDTLWWTNIAIKNGHRNSGFSH